MAGKPSVEAMRKAVADKKASAFKRTEEDASEIFGKGTKRVRYTDPHSAGYMEILHRPENYASTISLEVPEEHRGKGIAGRLQAQAIKDFPSMQGQVSSKHAAKSAYRLGRRPHNEPKATLEDVFKRIDEDSSVNMLSPKRQSEIDAFNKTTPQYAKGGTVSTPTLEQMRHFIMQHMARSQMMHKAEGGSVDIATVGINEAPDMDVKEAALPAATTADNTMPTGGVDFQPQAPGMQLAPQAPAPQPGQAPGTPGQPQGMPQVGQSVGMPGQGMPTMPAPQGASPVAAGAPPTNILSRTPQGNMLQAMKPMARMKDGGSTTTAQMKQELDSNKALKHAKPIAYKDAMSMVKGHTEKPQGTDPTLHLSENKEYHYGNIPLEFFKENENGHRYDGTVDIKRAKEYAKRESKNAPPVIAGTRFGGKLNILDGGHRISAARMRGDTHIPAIIHVGQPKKLANGGKVKGVIKEKVKVTPTGDAMMYELTRAQRYTKKVK